MSKRMTALTRNGYTFGMEVDGIQAARVMRKSENIIEKFMIGETEHTRRKNGIKSNLIAGLMGREAWHVTENRSFVWVQFDDSMRYYVIYPEVEEKS